MDIFCPHCEKPLGAEHDEKACRRSMSRRIFFGVCLAPLAAKIMPIPQRFPFIGLDLGGLDFSSAYAVLDGKRYEIDISWDEV